MPAHWLPRCSRPAGTPAVADSLTDNPDVAAILRFAATEVVPRLRRHRGARSIRSCARLDGRFIAAGPSGSPLRGLVNVLPTGRNFYSVDPKAVPSRLAWETGAARWPIRCWTATASDHGSWPRSVGLSVWGTSAMRTSGDDIAEVLALLGVRPVWDDASRRVVDLEPISLGRTRQAAHRRHRADLRLLPRRLPARGHHARRRGARSSRASTSPPTTNYVRAHARGRHRRARRPTPRHHKDFRLEAGHLRRRAAAVDRQPQLARRRRPRRGVHRLGRLRLRPRPRRGARRRRHEPAVPPDRGGRQEHRHPRARHRRLRRLLPVPRRHGRHRARADRSGARPPTSATTPGPTPCAPARCRRRPRGCSGPGWSTRAG